MERWIRIADVDGFNVGHVIVPQAWEDVIDFLIPVLENRGWLGDHNEYSVPGGTLRENLYGTPRNSYVRSSHPASKFKFEVYKDEESLEQKEMPKLDVEDGAGKGLVAQSPHKQKRAREQQQARSFKRQNTGTKISRIGLKEKVSVAEKPSRKTKGSSQIKEGKIKDGTRKLQATR